METMKIKFVVVMCVVFVACLISLNGCTSSSSASGSYFTEDGPVIEGEEMIPVTEIGERKQIYTAYPQTGYGLPWTPWDETPPEIPGTQIRFDVLERSTINVEGHIKVAAIKAREVTPEGKCGVGIAVTLNGYRIWDSSMGKDVPKDEKYWPIMLDGFAIVEPGEYTVALIGRSYSSATDVDGLAETGWPEYTSVVRVFVEVLD